MYESPVVQDVRSLLHECIDILEAVDSVIQVVECVTYVVDQTSMIAVTLDNKKPAKRIVQPEQEIKFRYIPFNRKHLEKKWTSLIPNIRRSQFQKAFIRHKRITVRRKIGEIFDHFNRHGNGSGTLTRAGIKRTLTLHMGGMKKLLDAFPVLQSILRPKYFLYAIYRIFDENAINKENFIKFVLRRLISKNFII